MKIITSVIIILFCFPELSKAQVVIDSINYNGYRIDIIKYKIHSDTTTRAYFDERIPKNYIVTTGDDGIKQFYDPRFDSITAFLKGNYSWPIGGLTFTDFSQDYIHFNPNEGFDNSIWQNYDSRLAHVYSVEAILYYEKQIELFTETSELYYQLANSWSLCGRIGPYRSRAYKDKILTYLDQCLAIDSNHQEAKKLKELILNM